MTGLVVTLCHLILPSRLSLAQRLAWGRHTSTPGSSAVTLATPLFILLCASASASAAGTIQTKYASSSLETTLYTDDSFYAISSDGTPRYTDDSIDASSSVETSGYTDGSFYASSSVETSRYTDASFSEIGRHLGRNHPAVSNAIEKVEREILERAPLRYQVEELVARLGRD